MPYLLFTKLLKCPEEVELPSGEEVLESTDFKYPLQAINKQFAARASDEGFPYFETFEEALAACRSKKYNDLYHVAGLLFISEVYVSSKLPICKMFRDSVRFIDDAEGNVALHFYDVEEGEAPFEITHVYATRSIPERPIKPQHREVIIPDDYFRIWREYILFEEAAKKRLSFFSSSSLSTQTILTARSLTPY